MSGAARRDAERPVETESGAPARFPRVVEYSDERRDATRGREGGEEEEGEGGGEQWKRTQRGAPTRGGSLVE